MAARYLEVTLGTKGRLGFYKEITDVVDVKVLQWFKTQGDIIEGKTDPDTGAVLGEDIVEIYSAKGRKIIHALPEEIGGRIVEILLHEGEQVTLDIRDEPLRLAALEFEDGREETKEPARAPQQPVATKEEAWEPQRSIRVSPLARRAAEELGVSLEDVRAQLPADAVEMRLEDVRAYQENRKPREEEDRTYVRAAPATRRRAKELGIDLNAVKPSGLSGIIRLADVEDAAETEQARQPVQETPQGAVVEDDLYGAVIVQPSVTRLTIARNMQRARNSNFDPGRGINIPDAGAGLRVNVVALVALREKLKVRFEEEHGIKLRYDHFFLSAAAKLLRQEKFAKLNGAWEWLQNKRGQIVRFSHINLGVAVAGPEGLVVPVIRRCEEKSFVRIAKTAEELIGKALHGTLGNEDQGGLTFIVNNTGALGDEFPDPIIAPGTGAILALGRAGHDGMMLAQLKFDHRLLDGHDVAPFLTELKKLLELPEQLLYT